MQQFNIENFILTGEVPIDGNKDKIYLDHIIDWLKIKEEMGVYFVYYEDLKQVCNFRDLLKTPILLY